MATDDSVAQLREQGVALLRGVFSAGSLACLKEAAARCFEAIRTEGEIPEHYLFNPYSHSVILSALRDFGCGSEDLVAPLSAPGLGRLFSDAVGREWMCDLQQSWVRKKFAPMQEPSHEYRPHSWHQDGALGVHFPPEAGAVIPMTELVTCWIPLDPCGRNSPGLEFVRGRQAALVHFTELDDSVLRRRFGTEEFEAPELKAGDGLVFLNSVLHRTYVCPEMMENRLSVEYRIFPVWWQEDGEGAGVDDGRGVVTIRVGPRRVEADIASR